MLYTKPNSLIVLLPFILQDYQSLYTDSLGFIELTVVYLYFVTRLLGYKESESFLSMLTYIYIRNKIGFGYKYFNFLDCF